MFGGAVRPGTLIYSGAVPLNAWTTTVKARVLKGSEWSALNEAVFVRSASPPPLRIVEILAHPIGPTAWIRRGARSLRLAVAAAASAAQEAARDPGGRAGAHCTRGSLGRTRHGGCRYRRRCPGCRRPCHCAARPGGCRPS